MTFIILQISHLECINALPLCWNFDSGSSGWFNAGTASGAYLWKFSAGGKPADTSNIPSFYSSKHNIAISPFPNSNHPHPTPYKRLTAESKLPVKMSVIKGCSYAFSASPYAFFQDQDTPPVEGTLCSPTIAGVGTGSTITLTVFRHIIETHLNDSSRPLLRFVEGGVSHNIEFDYNYDRWDTVTATCGTSAICCSTSFPCNGMVREFFSIIILSTCLLTFKGHTRGIDS